MVAKPKALNSDKMRAAKSATKTAALAMKPQSAPPPTAKATAAKPTSISAKVAQRTIASSSSDHSATADGASVLKMKDLLDKVVAISGAKKADARAVIEATLAVIGNALEKGDTLVLPPFGRAKVSRAAEAGSGKAMTIKLRRSKAAGADGAKATQTLADAED